MVDPLTHKDRLCHLLSCSYAVDLTIVSQHVDKHHLEVFQVLLHANEEHMPVTKCAPAWETLPGRAIIITLTMEE